MELAFNIAKCVAWASGLEELEDWQLWHQGKKNLSNELGLPSLKAIPAMQRRRLSPFAKVTLHCALESSNHYRGDLPCVFSSRHGDLHRTRELIENVALGNELSPTSFGLSVHNAVSGLYSVYTENHAPITAISSGEASFTAGLIDSIVKLHANKLSQVLYVYSDLVVPECYSPYVGQETSIGIGILINAEEDHGSQFIIKNSGLVEKPYIGFQALDFMQFFLGSSKEWRAQVNRQSWCLQRN